MNTQACAPGTAENGVPRAKISSGKRGGDLGEVRPGQMVRAVDQVIFKKALREVHGPVKSSFGYHLIQVVERDDARVKDETTIASEQASAFETWLQGLIAAAQIERGNINDLLPTDF